MASTRKVIVTCAVTGAIHTPSMSPHLPITPDEIVAEAVAAAERQGIEETAFGIKRVAEKADPGAAIIVDCFLGDIGGLTAQEISKLVPGGDGRSPPPLRQNIEKTR